MSLLLRFGNFWRPPPIPPATATAWRRVIMLSTPSLLLPATLLLLISNQAHHASATILKVTPTGEWTSSSGYSTSSRIYSLPDALVVANAGDTILLASGTYTDRVESLTAGTKNRPIKIKGSEHAIIRASSPSVIIQHSWITLQASDNTGERAASSKL